MRHPDHEVNKTQVMGQAVKWAVDIEILKLPNTPELREWLRQRTHPRASHFWVLKVKTPDNRREIPLNYQESQRALALVRRRHRGKHPEWMRVHDMTSEVVS